MITLRADHHKAKMERGSAGEERGPKLGEALVLSVLGTLGSVGGQHMHVQKIFYVTTLFH